MQRWLFPTSQKQTDAQPVVEQCLPWKTKLPTLFFPYPSFVAEHDVVWYGLTFWPGGAICPYCVSFQPLAHPQTTLGGDRVGKKKPGCCTSTLQQQLKQCCVINTLLATDLKHSTMQTAIKKVNCVSARHSTGTCVLHTPLQCNFL